MTKIMFADDLLGTFVLGLEITAEHPEAARNTLQEMIAGGVLSHLDATKAVTTLALALPAPATDDSALPWYVIVNPDWYDEDEGDAGYSWSGDAVDKADAINQALAACWSDNDRDDEPPTYDPRAHRQDGFSVYEATPDLHPLAAAVTRARQTWDTAALAAALDRLDRAVALGGHQN